MKYNPDVLETITLERERPKEESKPEVSIHRLGSQDLILLKQLIEIFKESFDGQSKKEIDEFSLNTMLRHVTFVGYVAMIGNEVVGGLTGYEIRSYYKGESEFFLYNLAVKPQHKKKGFGKSLMKTILAFSKEMGHSKLYVGAHIKGSNAVDFYRNSGAIEYQVSKFVYEL